MPIWVGLYECPRLGVLVFISYYIEKLSISLIVTLYFFEKFQ
ncbi:hypothetical protein KsCSTR_31480 [Candidatus Kuenenia stuttgartiensis]|uniref:Uncharacterized protein n=1 Tax=Kuenenia stuttgartiensis TaxID=174633 RepID=A0A6G7GTJ7_KUEST|nr:hypothetical protein KsCSTR_31480 [Candidatus Kuenenia stuttgartiensis]